MPTELLLDAREEDTYAIVATFTDENGDPATPATATWTLTNMEGTIINGRENVNITSPSSEETIVLSADDLALDTDEVGGANRILTVKATYNGSLGNGLPMNDSAYFFVKDITPIT